MVRGARTNIGTFWSEVVPFGFDVVVELGWSPREVALGSFNAPSGQNLGGGRPGGSDLRTLLGSTAARFAENLMFYRSKPVPV